MFCPNCGQERISQETSFCSKCGFLLTGTSELLKTGGVIPSSENSKLSKTHSSRNRGLKQGLFIFLLTFLITPLLAIIATALDEQPDAALIAAVVLGVGGLLRMVYALMFEPAVSAAPTPGDKRAIADPRKELNPASPSHALADIEAAPTTGQWRTTKELELPGSESATKPLEQQNIDQ